LQQHLIALAVAYRFVAHPRQMRDWKGDPPNLYDISGSAHFINKCDNGVVVHRNNDPNKGPQSEARRGSVLNLRLLS